MRTRLLLILLAVAGGLWATVPSGVALAAVATTDVEHAVVENVRSVPAAYAVKGVSDDDRYVLTTGFDGVYRVDVTTGARVRVDVYADGTPVAGSTSWAWLSSDGAKALSMIYVAASAVLQVLVRYIDDGYTTVYELPEPQPECGGYGQVTPEDVTPDVGAMLVEHYFGNCNPIGTHFVYRFAPNGSVSASEQLRDDNFSGELSDDASQIFYATGGCAPGAMFCSYNFGGIDRTLVLRKPLTASWSTAVREDIDHRGDGFATFTGNGSTFIYGSNLKNLEPGATVITSESYALYRGKTSSRAVRFVTGASGPPLLVDRSGRYVLSRATVVAPDGTRTQNYSVVDAWSNATKVRVLDLAASFGSALSGDLSGAWTDRDLRYAFRIRDVSGSPTLQRVALAGAAAAPCKPGDTNCDGWTRIAILGDSYISGEGAADGIDDREPPTEPGSPYHACTDIVDKGTCGYASDGRPYENKCHRSDASWAMRVAKGLTSGSDILFAACSGAITDDTLDHGQYDGLDGRPGPSPPGVFGGQPQLDALADFQAYRDADVVLLSIGGNDVKFPEVIARCLKVSCLVWPASGWKGDAQYEARHIGDRVAETIDRIRTVAGSAHVVLVGYPDPTRISQCGATGWGTSLLSIDAAEQQWLRDEYIGPLNDSLQSAASRAGATFVPFRYAFGGHEICSNLAYANGIKAGNDILGVFGKESFHPNAFGHRQLAELAQPYVRAVEGILPPEATIPLAPPLTHPQLRVTSPGAGQLTSQASPGSTAVLHGSGAPPNSSGILIFNSLPTQVGTWSADAGGGWSASINVPLTASPGPHLITAFDPSAGKDVATSGISVDTTATCATDPAAADADQDGMPDTCDPAPLDGPAADADGDGKSNDLDNCAVLANSTQADADANGLGDGCDPAAGGSLDDALRDPDNVAPAAPVLTLSPRQDSDRNATIAISGSDPDDDSTTLVHRCSLDGVPYTICTTPLQLTSLSLGTHELSVTTGDSAGNRSATAVIGWRVGSVIGPSAPLQPLQPQPSAVSTARPATPAPSPTPPSRPPPGVSPGLPLVAFAAASFPAGLTDVALTQAGKLHVPVTCPAQKAAACTVTIALRTAPGVRVRGKPRVMTLGTGRFSIPARATRVISLSASAAARQIVGATRRLRTQATLTSVNTATNATADARHTVNVRLLPTRYRVSAQGTTVIHVLVPGGAQKTRATLVLQRAHAGTARAKFTPTPGRVQRVKVRLRIARPTRATADVVYLDSAGTTLHAKRAIELRKLVPPRSRSYR